MQKIIITCVTIFVLRIIDTSVNTLCIMYTSQGNKKIAPMFGIIQTVTWVTALNLVMGELKENPGYLVIYALAYGVGVILGIILEEKIASGDVLIQSVVTPDRTDIIKKLRNEFNLLVTVLEGQGRQNDKRLVLFIAVRRKNLRKIVQYLRGEKLFVTVSKSQIFSNSIYEHPATKQLLKK